MLITLSSALHRAYLNVYSLSAISLTASLSTFVKFDREDSSYDNNVLSRVNKGKSQRHLKRPEYQHPKASNMARETLPAAKLYLKPKKIGINDYYQSVYDQILHPSLKISTEPGKAFMKERLDLRGIETVDQLFELSVSVISWL
jgi:hypothetical protein